MLLDKLWLKKKTALFLADVRIHHAVYEIFEVWKKILSNTASTLERKHSQSFVDGLLISVNIVLTLPGFSTSTWLVK